MTLLLLLSCSLFPSVGDTPKSDADCIATTGDNCSCEAQCLTETELEEAQREGVCDLGCMFDSSSSPNWTCEVEDGACVVVWPEE